MFLIIGSGPSGVIAAQALLDTGAEVTMVDVGDRLDPGRRDAVARLAEHEPAAWRPEWLEAVRGVAKFDPALPKLTFGSGFAYSHEQRTALVQRGTRCLLSHAQGGLSNVWGAAILPSRAQDLAGWPLSLGDLTPHYAAAARTLRLAGAHDGLERTFPYYAPPEAAPAPSEQASRVLARLDAHEAQLTARGLHFGRARLAMRTQDTEHARGCRYTGRCLAGCPYGAIWNAADELAALRRRPGFRYIAGVRVFHLEPGSDDVRVLGRERSSRAAVEFRARRVLVAAGSLGTPRLVLDSLRAYGRPFGLHFQPYFLLPLVLLAPPARGAPAVEAQPLHTLAQIFLDLVEPSFSPHTIHMQLYTYNEYIRERVAAVAKLAGPLQPALQRALVPRLAAIQAYLHSSEADTIRVVATEGPPGESAQVDLVAPDMARPHRLMRRVAGQLLAWANLLGVVPVIPLLHAGQPGEGNHLGGIFPMTRAPRPFETDLLGALPQLPRVHLVDASVLPSLPATTFTYTVMANAHRIASAVGALESAPG